ncbi:MAG: hypothetical protein SVM79_08280, partial [Chloroflexota bacterium]|nr:hypothetical protein [Chloroflexota bacterium]
MPKHDPIREMEDSTRKQKKAPERKLTANERTADLNPVSSDLPGGHTGMLSDARLLRSASAVQRAELISGLQRTHGNAYVQRLLIQAKLTVNPPDDKYEQEADQVGEAVANTFNSTAQRQEMPEEEEMLQTRSLQRQEMPEEEELLQGKSLQRQEMPEEEEMLQTRSLQRQEMPEEEEMLQTRSTGNRVPEVTDRLEERIN